jgi:hypothetical protein
MSIFTGPEIVNNGLVMCLDAANPNSLLSAVEVLVVAGGGGGGGVIGGGGGGGGFREATAFPITPGSLITVTVGDGGSGGFSWNSSSQRGNPGTDSIFSTITATGGGGGGAHGGADGRVNGTTGGSGGGGGGSTGSAGNTPSTTPSQGNSGGTGDGNNGGGGGGSSANGETRVAGVRGGNGGNGTSSSISGTLVTYAGGGGGGTRNGSGTGGTGGSGGGGNGGTTDLSRTSTHGSTNTGGGGGGGGHNGSGAGAVQSGSNGGSGIVIVRYPGPQRATGGTVTSVGGNTIHTFTTSGTFTLNIEADVSNNNNNGTLTNGVGYSSANKGSLVFDGVDDVVRVTNNFIPANSSISVAVWTKITTGLALVDTINDSVAWDGFGMWANLAGNKFRWMLLKQYDPQISAFLASNTSWTAGTWINVVGTYDQSTVAIYINGSFDASASYSGGYDVGTSFIGIGARPSAGNPSNCSISQVSIYNRALTAQEVQQNFNALKGRFGL